MNWPLMFENEKCFIKQILGEKCLDVHHVGSTSVPGLSSKADIDMLCVIENLSQSLILQEHGFIFKGELNIPLRYFFSKNTDISKINLHVVESDNHNIQQKLVFRNYLRSNPKAVIEYEKLKQSLIQNPRSHEKVKGTSYFSHYTLSKNNFIKSILKKAEFNRYCVNFCLHEEEWYEYNRIIKSRVQSYDKNDDAFLSDNYYHFICYKGVDIIIASMLEVVDNNQAIIKYLASDYKAEVKDQEYMTRFLDKWTRVHSLSVKNGIN